MLQLAALTTPFEKLVLRYHLLVQNFFLAKQTFLNLLHLDISNGKLFVSLRPLFLKGGFDLGFELEQFLFVVLVKVQDQVALIKHLLHLFGVFSGQGFHNVLFLFNLGLVLLHQTVVVLAATRLGLKILTDGRFPDPCLRSKC